MTIKNLDKLRVNVGRMMNILPESDFIDMVESIDDATYWQELTQVDEMSEDECLSVLYKLTSLYSEWLQN